MNLIEEIGENIRKIRREKGISLVELARMAGCSPSFISGVETSKALPSLTSLQKIADALNIPITELFEPDTPQEPVVMKPEDRLELNLDNYNGKVYLLVKSISNKRICPFYTVISPKGGTKLFSRHEGEEFGIVLKGTLQISLNSDIYLVRKNESFYYSSKLPHKWYNPGKEEALVVWVVSPPTSAIDMAIDSHKLPQRSGIA
jgi:transcriptional regulator with XRE-family HTH domain